MYDLTLVLTALAFIMGACTLIAFVTSDTFVLLLWGLIRVTCAPVMIWADRVVDNAPAPESKREHAFATRYLRLMTRVGDTCAKAVGLAYSRKYEILDDRARVARYKAHKKALAR